MFTLPPAVGVVVTVGVCVDPVDTGGDGTDSVGDGVDGLGVD
jgi:hypothetical protein